MSVTLTFNGGTVEIDETDLDNAIEAYLDNNSYMTHSAVTDTVEEYVKDNVDISGEVDEHISSLDITNEGQVQQMIDDALDDYQTESDVENLIENRIGDFVDRDDVRDMISSEVEDNLLDEDDVERIVSEMDNRDLRELSGRVDRYAQHVDEIRGHDAARQAQVDNWATAIQALQEAVKDGAGHSHANDHDVVTALVQRIEGLEADRSEHLRLIQDLQEQVTEVRLASEQAVTFYTLVKAAVDYVMRQVGR